MKKLDITKGIPFKEFKSLLSNGEPFQLMGEQILLFDKDKISRINREKLQLLQENDSMSVNDIHQMMETNKGFDFDNLKEVNGVEVSKYDKMMLAAGHTVTLGTNKVSIKEHQLHIESPALKKDTPKIKR